MKSKFTVFVCPQSGARFIAYDGQPIATHEGEIDVAIAQSLISVCQQIEIFSPEISPENTLKRATAALFGTYGESVKF